MCLSDCESCYSFQLWECYLALISVVLCGCVLDFPSMNYVLQSGRSIWVDTSTVIFHAGNIWFKKTTLDQHIFQEWEITMNMMIIFSPKCMKKQQIQWEDEWSLCKLVLLTQICISILRNCFFFPSIVHCKWHLATH